MSELDFPERLRQAMRYSSERRAKPWTQQQLARRAGTGQGTIGGWMGGRSLPSSKLLFELAEAFLHTAIYAGAPAASAAFRVAKEVFDEMEAEQRS